MDIIIVPREQRIPDVGISTAYLHVDRWNDFSFTTMFYMYLFDQKGERHDIGNVKIGFQGQTTEKSTYSTLGSRFRILPEGYFSVGQDVDYYQEISNLPESIKVSLLEALKDIAYAPELIDLVKDEEVFKKSLLRYVSLSVIKGQFARVLEGKNPLTNFEFKFIRPAQGKISDIELSFKVKVVSTPL